jgi:hypothetical protein
MDESPFYATALVLHPSYRLKYIQKVWEEEWREPTIQKVQNLWKEYKEAHQTRPSPTLSDQICIDPQQEPADEFDRIREGIRSDFQSEIDEEDDFNVYCSEGLCDIKRQSALEWWCQNQREGKWPLLSRFAIDVLSIPAMSDEPERVFSGGRRTITWERMSLDPDNIEKTECLKSWYRTGVSRVDQCEDVTSQMVTLSTN